MSESPQTIADTSCSAVSFVSSDYKKFILTYIKPHK
jgi:hypothetical protein